MTDVHGPKYKILCLHGIGTNADIFEAQTASIRYQLERDDPDASFEFDFVDGAHPWPAPPAIAAVYGPSDAYLSYFDGTAPSAESAIDDLAAYVAEQGPFDAIMGFSMGCLIAASLLIQPRAAASDKPEYGAARGMIRSAIFVCGLRPIEARKDQIYDIQIQDVRGVHGKWAPIQVPSVHLWSPQDEENADRSRDLRDMCSNDKLVEVLHSAGHAVPTNPTEVANAVRAIAKLFRNLPQRD